MLLKEGHKILNLGGRWKFDTLLFVLNKVNNWLNKSNNIAFKNEFANNPIYLGKQTN